ncbi:MAG: glycosyltransferase family 2 protein [Synergistales bacterium]|nr:glycosyltransferase family 2 protein [Synergistales bacterium]
MSVVVPLYNEEENVGVLHRRIRRALEGLDLRWEIIYINDGSTDGTWRKLEEIVRAGPGVVGISLRRNFGQTAAMSAGFERAWGEVIVTMDGDLQNDPADIPQLLDKLDEGCDIVSGWRKDRKDALISRRIPSRIANWLIARLTGVRLHDYGCSLKAYRSEVIKEIELYGELHRFIPALASMVGARVAEIPVNHFPRAGGTSKYGISRTPKVVLDLLLVRFLLRFRTRPIHLLGGMGLLLGGAGFGITLYLTILKFCFGEELSKRPLLIIGVLFILVGTQLFTTGLLAELLIRAYYKDGKRPYWVRETLGRGLGQ